MFMEEKVYTEWRQQLPLFFRILKDNNHYKLFLIGLEKSEYHADQKMDFNHIVKFFISNVVKRSRDAQIHTLHYNDWWSIHKNQEQSLNGWVSEFNYNKVGDDVIIMIVIVYGMLLNVSGLDGYGRGMFYDDYQQLKKILLK